MRSAPAPQPGLFAEPSPLREVYAEAEALALGLPDTLRLGTSSWAYPGWKGLVYAQGGTESRLSRHGLGEYARHPLLRTVGVDRSYYSPLPPEDLARYASQLPAGFPCVLKAPASVMSAIAPGSDRAGVATANRDFLSAERFADDFATRVVEHFLPHAGVVVLEFPRVPKSFMPSAAEFARRLDAFLAEAPPQLAYAVELRERAHFTPGYLKVLRARGAAHVYNWWSAMPDLASQSTSVPPESMPFVVARVMLPPGSRYEDRERAFAPFDRVREPHPAMHREVAELVTRAASASRPSWVLVSNKAEGCSPATVVAIARAIAAR